MGSGTGVAVGKGVGVAVISAVGVGVKVVVGVGEGDGVSVIDGDDVSWGEAVAKPGVVAEGNGVRGIWPTSTVGGGAGVERPTACITAVMINRPTVNTMMATRKRMRMG